MNRPNTSLSATLNATDKSAAKAAIDALSFERRSIDSLAEPLALVRRNRRRGYVTEVLALQNAIRRALAEAAAWRLSLEPQFSVRALLPLYQKEHILPSSRVRALALDSSLYVLEISGKTGLPADCTIAGLRAGFRLAPSGKTDGLTILSHFPRRQMRPATTGKVRFGLRPDLAFWTPYSPERRRGLNAPYGLIATPGLVLGPNEMTLSGLVYSTLAANSGQIDVYMSRTGRATSGVFGAWLVVQVPRNCRKVEVTVSFDAEIRLPHPLGQFLGSGRFLRASGHVSLTLPAAGKLPSGPL